MILRAGSVAAMLMALLPVVIWADTPPAGNDVFQIVMEDAASADGRGTFGVITGPGHPLGAGVDVLSLRDGDDAFASYLTVRSYTTGTDYVQTLADPASGNLLVPLDQYATVAEIPGGFRATYDVPASSAAAEALAITVAIAVSGEGMASAILIDVSVVNKNSYPITVGLRLLLDIASGGDDGPRVGSANVTSVEAAISPPFSQISVPPGSGELLLTTSPAPAAVILAHWNRAFQSAFAFEPDGSDVTSAGGLNDSALLYYFGASQTQAAALSAADAITLGPGASTTVRVTVAPVAQEASPTPTPSPSLTAPSNSPGPQATAPPGGVSPTATTAPAGLPASGGMLGMTDGETRVALLAGSAALILAAITGFWMIKRRRSLD